MKKNIKSNMLVCIGITADGKKIYKGIYRFYETVGLPLDVLFDCIARKDAVVSWIDFYKEASLAGMKHDRILSKLGEAVCDVWGKDFYDVVESGLNKFFT